MATSTQERTVETVSFDQLAHVVRGTGIVERIDTVPEGARLRLAFPGRAVETVVPGGPVAASRVRNELGFALAVQVRVRPGTVEATVLGSTAEGPQRVEISLDRALGLTAAGIRTVVVTG